MFSTWWRVPQLFAATGAARFTDPKNFPWTFGFNPSYFVEGRIYGQYILKEHPNAKVGVLRTIRSDHRFADPQDQGCRCGSVLQCLDTQAGCPGDQEDR